MVKVAKYQGQPIFVHEKKMTLEYIGLFTQRTLVIPIALLIDQVTGLVTVKTRSSGNFLLKDLKPIDIMDERWMRAQGYNDIYSKIIYVEEPAIWNVWIRSVKSNV
jgi:hypothetical protein